MGGETVCSVFAARVSAVAVPQFVDVKVGHVLTIPLRRLPEGATQVG